MLPRYFNFCFLRIAFVLTIVPVELIAHPPKRWRTEINIDLSTKLVFLSFDLVRQCYFFHSSKWIVTDMVRTRFFRAPRITLVMLHELLNITISLIYWIKVTSIIHQRQYFSTLLIYV